MKKLIVAVALSGCTAPDPNPQLRSYGALFPFCLLLCEASVNTAEIAEGATQSNSTQRSSSKSVSP